MTNDLQSLETTMRGLVDNFLEAWDVHPDSYEFACHVLEKFTEYAQEESFNLALGSWILWKKELEESECPMKFDRYEEWLKKKVEAIV